MPVIFAVGQVANLADPTFDLAGFSVTLNVKATWTWDFDDGAPETFTKPGGALSQPGRHAHLPDVR